jgi:predicted enzyme related to lactoylglutathione lyase
MQTHIIGGIGHFEIAGPDAAALQTFYSDVFDWAVLPKGPGYALIDTPKGSASGAIVEAEDASLTIGVIVADLELSLAAALDCGGTIVMPVTDNGWVKKAAIADPAGNRVTLIQA